MFSVLRHVRMLRILLIESINSFMMEAPVVEKSAHWCAEQINGMFLYDRDVRHERINKSGE